MLVTLGGDDFVSLLGQKLLGLSIDRGRGDDWVNVQEVSATITDLQGNNTILTGGGDDTIHTGPGDDEIDAQGGRNKIVDDGGKNRILTGDQDDEIRHENAEDWIIAAAGVNHIWLSGVHQGWQNPKLAADVNRDGLVTALDALIVLNRLSAQGSHVLVGSADSVSQYYDANGDGLIAPIDALFVLNRMPGSWPIRGGEGESDITRLQDAARDSEDGIGSGIEGLDLTFVTGRRDASARRIDDFFHGYDGSMGLDDAVEDGELRLGRRGQPRRWK
jgi:Ca2+-binding RTX toxin-like protein